MKESELVRQCLDYLAIQGHFAWRQNSGAVTATHKGKSRFVRFNGAPGASDIIGVLKGGRMIAVECKIKPNRPTKLQERYLELVNERGGLGIVVFSLQDLIDALK